MIAARAGTGVDEHGAPGAPVAPGAPGAPVAAHAGADDIPLPFDVIFARYHGAIYRYLRMVGDVELAQDLAQDAFLKAYKALPRTPNSALPGWLYRIAANTAFDALRHRQRLTWLPFAPGAAERLPAPEGNLPAACAEREAVRLALAWLTPPQRACLLLRARDGLAIEEIAHVLDMSSGNVKITLYRAKERFRAVYADPAR